MSQAFEAVYSDHYDRLFTLAFRMTGNKDDAEDVLQICFLQAYEAFASFRRESSVYTWLYRILMNAARRFVKARTRLPIYGFAERTGRTVDEAFAYVNGYGSSEDTALVSMIRESCLQMFMNCMPPRYRAVFTLRSILDFSVRETADILEISENAVRVYLHRARKLAADHFNNRCSLVAPGGVCSCRTFASFRKEVGLQGLPGGIAEILSKEQRAAGDYRREMGKLLDVDRLYRTRFSPESYKDFIERIRRLKTEDRLRVLGG
jgi:RNA polymerase sigma-70 factor (ECF subfamily)